jgi:hypothetical protein
MDDDYYKYWYEHNDLLLMLIFNKIEYREGIKK